jgi:hypothetical protein
MTKAALVDVIAKKSKITKKAAGIIDYRRAQKGRQGDIGWFRNFLGRQEKGPHRQEPEDRRDHQGPGQESSEVQGWSRAETRGPLRESLGFFTPHP